MKKSLGFFIFAAFTLIFSPMALSQSINAEINDPQIPPVPTPQLPGYRLAGWEVKNFGSEDNPFYFKVATYEISTQLYGNTNVFCNADAQVGFSATTGVTQQDKTDTTKKIAGSVTGTLSFEADEKEDAGVVSAEEKEKASIAATVSTEASNSMEGLHTTTESDTVLHNFNWHNDSRFNKGYYVYQTDIKYQFTPITYSKLYGLYGTEAALQYSLQQANDAVYSYDGPTTPSCPANTIPKDLSLDLACLPNNHTPQCDKYNEKKRKGLLCNPDILRDIPYHRYQESLNNQKSVEIHLKKIKGTIAGAIKAINATNLDNQITPSSTFHPIPNDIEMTVSGEDFTPVQIKAVAECDNAKSPSFPYKAQGNDFTDSIYGVSHNNDIQLPKLIDQSEDNDISLDNSGHFVEVKLKFTNPSQDEDGNIKHLPKTFNIITDAKIEEDGDIQPSGWPGDFASYGEKVTPEDLPADILILMGNFAIVDDDESWILNHSWGHKPAEKGERLEIIVSDLDGIQPHVNIVDENRFVVEGTQVELEGIKKTTDEFGIAYFHNLIVPHSDYTEIKATHENYVDANKLVKFESHLPTQTHSVQINTADVICEGKVWLESTNGRIACVNPSTSEKLVDRGWGQIIG